MAKVNQTMGSIKRWSNENLDELLGMEATVGSLVFRRLSNTFQETRELQRLA